MKPILIPLFLGAVSLAYGGLDIPSHVYSIDEIEEAKAEAMEDGEPLVFLNTNSKPKG